MKPRVRILLASTMLVGLLAACGPSSSATTTGGTHPSDPYHFTNPKEWAGHEGEEVYTFGKNDDGLFQITYTDAKGEGEGGWEFAAHAFSNDKMFLPDFAQYRKLVISAKIDVTAGSPGVMVKIERGEGGVTIESRFKLTTEFQTFELPVTSITDWTKENMLLFFVNRAYTGNGSGVITFKDLCITKAELDPHNINITPPAPAVPDLYNGELPFKVMGDWGHNEHGIIETAKDEDGHYHFTYAAGTKNMEWTYVYAQAKDGTAHLEGSGIKRIHFVISGTAGTAALLKFEKLGSPGARECRIDSFAGGDEEHDLDVADLMADSAGATYQVSIFPAPGAKGPELAGEIVLKDCYMDGTEAVVPVPPQGKNLYDGGDHFTVMTDWGYDDDGNITTAKEGDVYRFTYGNGSKTQPWSKVCALVADGEATLKGSGFKRIHFELSGTAKNVLVKFQEKDSGNAKEKGGITLTGQSAGYDLDVAGVLDAGADNATYLVMIFPEAGHPEENEDPERLEGEVILHDCYMDGTEAVVPVHTQGKNLYDGGDHFTVMTDWGYDGDKNITTEYKEDGYHFTYGNGSKTEQWSKVCALVADGKAALKDSGFKRIHFVISGTAGKDVLLKFEGAGNYVESRITFVGGVTGEYDLNVSDILSDGTSRTVYQALIFPAPGLMGAELSGEIVLHDCYMDGTEAVVPAPSQGKNLYDGGDHLTVMTDWGYDQDNNITTAKEGNFYRFTYGNGSKTQPWSNVKALVKDGTFLLEGSKILRIHFRLSGTENTSALLKFEKLGSPEVKTEFTIENFTGEDEEHDLAISTLIKASMDSTFQVSIFPAPGQTGDDLAGEIILKYCYMDINIPIIPEGEQGTNDYDGVLPFHIMKDWGHDTEQNIATEKDMEGHYHFYYANGSKTDSYSYVTALVKDGAANLKTSGIKYIHFVISSRNPFRARFSGADPSNFKQTRQSSYSDDEKHIIDIDITDVLASGADGDIYRVIFWPGYGQAGNSTGSAILYDCYMDDSPTVTPEA